MPKTDVVVPLTIPAGEAESNGGNCTAGSNVALAMPTDWTPALLHFEVSANGNDWFDLVDQTGAPICLNVVPGTIISIPEGVAWPSYLKLRSGPRDRPILQTEARQFGILVRS